MRKLLLVAVVLVSGLVNAQKVDEKVGDWSVWSSDDSTSIYTMTDATEFQVSLAISKSKDGSSSMSLYYTDVEHGGVGVLGYVTIDGGSTFESAIVTPKEGTGLIDIKDLLSKVDTDEFVRAKEVWIAINDEVFKFSMNGFAQSIVLVSNYKFLSGNPFQTENPFGSNELVLYLDAYVDLAKEFGVDLSTIYDSPISITFGDLSGKLDDPRSLILGIAYGADDDSKVEIVIDPKGWMQLDDVSKTSTMFHELSHDILNASHVHNEDHLMHPSAEIDESLELINAMSVIFREYKDGTLEKFNENTTF